MKQEPLVKTHKNKSLHLTLWMPVVLAFFVVATAWYFLIQIARENPTQNVPLEYEPAAQYGSH